MIEKYSRVKEILKYDLYRYGGKITINALIKTLFTPGFRFTFFLRLCFEYRKIFVVNKILRFFLRMYSHRYGIQIPYNTEIGKGLYIGHFGNIIVNNAAKIGDNCNINQGVTIGQTNRGNRMGAPNIGNNVWIGANSVIVGKIIIGNNVLIAPLSYVNVDIPNDSIAIGNPLRIISKSNATSGYINRLYNPNS